MLNQKYYDDNLTQHYSYNLLNEVYDNEIDHLQDSHSHRGHHRHDLDTWRHIKSHFSNSNRLTIFKYLRKIPLIGRLVKATVHENLAQIYEITMTFIQTLQTA